MNQSKNPIWKKSMLSKLNFVEICEWLDEIAQNGDPFGYETDRTGHYNDYKELFDDLSDSACHLRDALREQEVEKNWDDMAVALLGATYTVLGYDKVEADYYHICFLDEIFKANDGVLNSLLKALNERTYTNEGVSVSIPVISFFAASNEIPNFHNPEEKSLRALYDRFDFKVCTRYVEDKANRMRILAMKQDPANFVPDGFQRISSKEISLDELYQMQEEVRAVKIPGSINELADNILCELRRKEISVTDRKYFNFGLVVQAEAWLAGRDTVQPQDMKALVNYLWDKPEDREIVEEAITRLTENPLGDKLDELLARAYQCRDEFDSADNPGLALIALRSGLLAVYDEAEQLKDSLAEKDPARSTVEGMIATLEGISREAHAKTSFTYLPLPELKAYKQMSA